MGKYVTDVTSMSSKGQIVIPKSIRNSLNLPTGTRFVVITEGNSILLKPIVIPDMEEYERLMNEAQRFAESTGLKQEDIDKTIKEVRKSK